MGVNKSTTIKQQFIAVCLLVLFLFITISKLLHSHDGFNDSRLSSIEKVEEKSVCSVCDYHLAKDAVFEATTFFLEESQVPPTHIIYYQGRTISSTGLSYSDRGPPSVA